MKNVRKDRVKKGIAGAALAGTAAAVAGPALAAQLGGQGLSGLAGKLGGKGAQKGALGKPFQTQMVKRSPQEGYEGSTGACKRS